MPTPSVPTPSKLWGLQTMTSLIGAKIESSVYSRDMTQEELLSLINQAANEGWKKLDLFGEELTEVPPEIGQLINLTELNIGLNQLKEIPESISQSHQA